MVGIILFVFGLAVGSFLNVVALRYRGDHFVFSPKVIGGRSHCPHCGHHLAWYELIPVASYLAQGGRCRKCRRYIGAQYPLVELLCGLIFAFVPPQVGYDPLLSALWIVALIIILLVSYIDIRLQIVPNELDIVLGVIAIFAAIFMGGDFGMANQSVLGTYATFFGLQNNLWLAHIAGAVFGAGFFAVLIAITRGKGMGWGDVKLGAPLGFLFGWPDILFVYAVAFIIGAVVGGIFLARRKKNMKSALPFVPFLAAGTAVVFFFGSAIFGWYFRHLGL